MWVVIFGAFFLHTEECADVGNKYRRKERMKKLLSLVLVLALLATVCVSVASADELKNLNTYET